MNRCPDGRETSLCAYSAYTSWPGCSLSSAVRHMPPSAVGNTHASSVARVLRSSDALSGTVTQSFTPSKVRAPSDLARRGPHGARDRAGVTASGRVGGGGAGPPRLVEAPVLPVPGGRRRIHGQGDRHGLRRAGGARRGHRDGAGVRAGASPAMFVDTESGRCAAAGRRHVQPCLVVGRRPLSVPPPVFDTFTVWAAGFAPPAVAVNERLAGASPPAAGFTVSVMATVFGEPVAPARSP